MKGRRPKDPALKELHGNTRRQAKGAAAAPAAKSAETFFSDPWDPPPHLSEEAQQIWREMLPTVRAETQLQRSSLPVFGLYCTALADWRSFDATIRKDGAVYTTASGYRRPSPEVALRAAAAREAGRLAVELNLTPKSWIGSMGTFKGQQLDLFMHGNGKAAAPAPSASPVPATEDSIDAFLGNRPTTH
jgi:P27 family predicted phage terminase small subunit